LRAKLVTATAIIEDVGLRKTGLSPIA